MCPGPLPPVLLVALPKKEGSALSASRLLAAAAPAERPPASLCSRSRSWPAAQCRSDHLCCFLSGAASPPSHSVLRNAPRAASLAFTAVWLGLPSPSFRRRPVCRGRCWGRWGREVIWWGGRALGAGRGSGSAVQAGTRVRASLPLAASACPGHGTRQRRGWLTWERWARAKGTQEGGLGGDCAQDCLPTMRQGSGRGCAASPGLHAQLHPPRLAADPLSCHPAPALSPDVF